MMPALLTAILWTDGRHHMLNKTAPPPPGGNWHLNCFTYIYRTLIDLLLII